MASKKHINKKVKRIILAYINHLKATNINIEKADIFGSYVHDNHDKFSDTDLCVISHQFKSENDTWEILWQNRTDEDIKYMLSPVGYHPNDFIDEDPLVHEIKMTGVEIEI